MWHLDNEQQVTTDSFSEVLSDLPPASPSTSIHKRRREEETPHRAAVLNRMNEAVGVIKALQPSRIDAWGAFGVHIAETGRKMEEGEPILAQKMKIEIQSTILKFESMVLEKQSVVLAEYVNVVDSE